MIRCETFPLGEVPDFVFPLWREAFGDDDGTVRHLLSAASEVYAGFLPTDKADGEVCAGIACAFDVSIGERRGKYLYAVCTAEHLRGRGVMRAVLDHASAEAERNGDSFAFLIPAKEEYFPMYERLGFTRAYPGLISVTGARTSLSSEDFAALPTAPFDGDADRLYALYLRSPQTVVRKGERLFYLSIEGFEIAYLSRNGTENPDGYVIFERNGKKSLNILEIRGCSDEISGIIKREIMPKLFVSGKSSPRADGGQIASPKKALFRFCHGNGPDIPADTPIDLFLEL